MMRHVIPDCFIPKESRRLRFEDDRGSVVRYRLDLDTEEPEEKDEFGEEEKKRKGWLFRLRSN